MFDKNILFFVRKVIRYILYQDGLKKFLQVPQWKEAFILMYKQCVDIDFNVSYLLNGIV